MRPTLRQILHWLQRALLVTGAIVVTLLIAGRIYQTAATEADQEKFPPPGLLVNVDGYRMHIYCTGQGSPTLLLDHAGDGSSVDWALIQPELAKHTRVCAYDRAGFGWSDYNPAPRTLQQQVHELHSLLQGANEKGPYILVGHSYGARVSRVFATKYPDEVLGMVLMDPGMIYDDPRYPQEALVQFESDSRMVNIMKNLAPFGVARLVLPMLGPSTYDLPQDAQLASASFRATDRQWKSMTEQMDALPIVFVEEHSVTTLGDIPLLILLSTEPDYAVNQAWRQANMEMADLSTQGTYQIIQGATHMSLVYRKTDARVSTDGILSILGVVRAKSTR